MSYYEDDVSKWYISANGKHSTFPNQLKDYDLSEKVTGIIDMRKEDPTFDTRFEYKIKDNTEQFSVWIDEDPNRNKLYRLTPPVANPVSNSGTSSPTTTGSTSKPSPFLPKGPGGFFASKSHDLVTLEEYKEKSAKDPLYRPLTVKEKTPNNFMIFENGKKIVWIWVGHWIKSQNQ